jgi:hypothetical protein
LPPPEARAAGCSYAPRCRRRLDRCATDLPPLVPLADSSGLSACWLTHDGTSAALTKTSSPATEDVGGDAFLPVEDTNGATS